MVPQSIAPCARGPSIFLQYVLSIMFKGKPTHHQMSLGEDGKLGINGGNRYGYDTTSVVDFIDNLRTKPEGWPVQMKAFVPAADPEPPNPAAGGGSKKGGIYVSTSHPWLYGAEINKAAVRQLRHHFDHFSTIYRLHPTPHALWAVFYLVPSLTSC